MYIQVGIGATRCMHASAQQHKGRNLRGTCVRLGDIVTSYLSANTAGVADLVTNVFQRDIYETFL